MAQVVLAATTTDTCRRYGARVSVADRRCKRCGRITGALEVSLFGTGFRRFRPCVGRNARAPVRSYRSRNGYCYVFLFVLLDGATVVVVSRSVKKRNGSPVPSPRDRHGESDRPYPLESTPGRGRSRHWPEGAGAMERTGDHARRSRYPHGMRRAYSPDRAFVSPFRRANVRSGWARCIRQDACWPAPLRSVRMLGDRPARRLASRANSSCAIPPLPVTLDAQNRRADERLSGVCAHRAPLCCGTPYERCL